MPTEENNRSEQKPIKKKKNRIYARLGYQVKIQEEIRDLLKKLIGKK
jgi:hypothetical protein